ncbi:MAG: RidA family protein [Candidatus Caldatribacteriaceae bacterium]
MDNYYKRLQRLGFQLPPPKPVGAYLPALQVGDLVFTSGQLPILAGELRYQGKLGKELTLEDGKRAAEICVLNALSVIETVVGNLEKIAQVIRLVGYIASAEGFTAHSS